MLFDIVDLGGGFYGQQAWSSFLHSVDPNYLAGCLLSHGDTDEGIAGRDRPYCFAIAVDWGTTEQASYVVETMSESQAIGLMPVAARFATGNVAQQQPLIEVAWIDERGRFVLVDDALLWLLKAVDNAGWQHKIDRGCLSRFVEYFRAPYEDGNDTYHNNKMKLVYARTFRETGGTEVLQALKMALHTERDPTVRQIYEETITDMQHGAP